ncbi:MAG: hypothetical protein SOW15_00580 [Ruminococcus callidus]|nr:hypothetical protein [Ruminococcus callidus]
MQNLQFCNTGNALPVVALPPRAVVHTVLAKPMALQPLLAALQTTMLFAIEGSIFRDIDFENRNASYRSGRNSEKIIFIFLPQPMPASA